MNRKQMFGLTSWIIKAVLVAGVSFLFKNDWETNQILVRQETEIQNLKETVKEMKQWRQNRRNP